MISTEQTITISRLWRICHMCLVFAAGLFLVATAHSATVPNQRLTFDHLTTGFALTGQHEFVSCEACHVGAVFKGTPKQCTGCHNGVIASGKSANHIPTTAGCDSCHSVAISFVKSAKMDHSTITGACGICHNGTLATGKNTGHVTTVRDCGACHLTVSFKSANFSHDGISTGCIKCHDGVGATGKNNLTHIPAPDSCETCHTTAVWKPAKVDHTSYAGNCATCHGAPGFLNVSVMSGKHSIGMTTSNVCDACHSKAPGRWKPITKFDHDQIKPVSTACATCHDGTGKLAQRGKGSTHIATPSTQACTDCHNVTAWKPTLFDHTSTQTLGKICADCHNGIAARGMGAVHIKIKSPFDCKACHASNTNWIVSRVDHNQTLGSCESCHNGISAKTKSSNHIATTDKCGMCHTTINWNVAASVVDHSQIQNACVSCHISGNTVNVKTFKSLTHPNTTNNCTACHDVAPTAWKNYKKPVDHKEVLGSCANSGCHVAPTTAMTKSITHPPTTNRCEACHMVPPAVWKDYKKPVDHREVLGNCVFCHNGTISQGKGPTHPNTSDKCLACHALPPAKWAPAQKVDHAEVKGNCIDCHDGVKASGKSAKHPSTSTACAACHATAPAKWIPILKMNHAETTATCITCHNGIVSKGKGASHISTTDNCTACHNTTVWLPYTKVDHNETRGVCSSCHNGTTAIGKSLNHIKTTQQCDYCHSTGGWKPTQFDHSPAQIGTNACFDCHNGINTRGKGVTHIATSNLCSTCHKPHTNWIPVLVDHTQVLGSCVSCHVSGTPNVNTFKSATHPRTTNNCIACHSSGPPAKWKPVLRVDHNEVLGSCASSGCHSAPTIATTKPLTHMPTTNRCEACHVSTVWKPVPSTKVNHLEVIGACFGCHNGTTVGVISKKGSTHLASTNSCDNCHDVPPGGAGWRLIIVDHTQVIGTCISCHNGTITQGKGTAHPNTTNNCVACHSSGPPAKWKPALRVDHNEVLGSCGTCHNGINAKGKGSNHFVTTAECNVCHTVKGWTPATYTHIGGTRYVRHTFDTCSRCHNTIPATATAKKPWPQYLSCASCHADDHVRGHGGTVANIAANHDNCLRSGCHTSTSNWGT